MKVYKLIKMLVHYYKVVFPNMSLKEYFKYYKMMLYLENNF